MAAASVLFDVVYVAGCINSVATVESDQDSIYFVNEAYKHCKAIAANASAVQVLKATSFGRNLPADTIIETVMAEGIIVSENVTDLATKFIAAIAQHRFWDREKARKVPA